MSWNIVCLENTVLINNDCVNDLYNIEDDRIAVDDQDHMIFDQDHHEFMDWLSEPDVQYVLKSHRVKGLVTFGSLQGDNFNTYWGYYFEDGSMKKLVGEINWFEEEVDNSIDITGVQFSECTR